MNPAAAPVHCFVVEDAGGTSYELDIARVADRAKQHLQSVWQRLSLAVETWGKIESLVVPGWTQWKPWKWCDDTRAAYQPRQQFVAWCGNTLAGILNVWPGFASVHEAGKDTLYVEHVGAAPGNLNAGLWDRRYRGVGQALMAYAVKLSQEQGFDGRLSLHAADDPALNFYRHLQAKLGGSLFHPERTGVIGPTPHGPASDGGRTYLEMKQTEAIRLLEVYRV
jgi:GNAT superfamily N-acetyltransferase